MVVEARGPLAKQRVEALKHLLEEEASDTGSAPTLFWLRGESLSRAGRSLNMDRLSAAFSDFSGRFPNGRYGLTLAASCLPDGSLCAVVGSSA